MRPGGELEREAQLRMVRRLTAAVGRVGLRVTRARCGARAANAQLLHLTGQVDEQLGKVVEQIDGRRRRGGRGRGDMPRLTGSRCDRRSSSISRAATCRGGGLRGGNGYLRLGSGAGGAEDGRRHDERVLVERAAHKEGRQLVRELDIYTFISIIAVVVFFCKCMSAHEAISLRIS